MKNSENFNQKSNYYIIGRQSYPQEIVKILLQKNQINMVEKTSVADVGAGTGLFSQALLAQNLQVNLVEPNSEMLLQAKKTLMSKDNITFSLGSAECTNLPALSQDLVTAAQAFHWFNADLFKKECQRILKPSDKVMLVWNSRDIKAPIMEECAEVAKRFCENFKGYSAGMDINNSQQFETFFKDGKINCLNFSNNLIYNEAEFIARSLSSSYAPTSKDLQYTAYIKAIKEVFRRYCNTNYQVTIENTLCSYCGYV
jgi:Methylase involved in ubiquinone/menaquinone biosynthesis